MTTLFLVVDEVVPVWKFQYRIRIWRQAGCPPVVLCSQVSGHPAPGYVQRLEGPDAPDLFVVHGLACLGVG